MKNLKKVLALVLAVVMIMSVVTVASAKTYTDVKATDNYADAIDALSSLNILDGFKDGDNYSFKADGTFTRAQAAKIVAIVHNAATNGAIKGQDAISGLYSNAQNPFVDCNSNWALPFINYCRITGLADGMTATTYAPNRELTGVQWLKLMLTTLNFDTAKEGYTGTGWDVNVLNRANEIGLTAGLAKDWKAIAPITRGEAAQVLYNALTKYLVEYGQLVKGFDTRVETPVFNAAFVSNEQVAKSGFTLAAKMGISIARTTDKFRRPGYTWSYGTWSKFYMDKPLNSYTTAVSMCDILKNDLGIAENDDTAVALNGFYKGDTSKTTEASKLLVKGEKAVQTALNYFAVDGRKYAYGTGDYAGVTLVHAPNKACQKDTKGWWNANFGGQGDLTQVFATEDGYVITTIHTFLAEVKSVVKNNKYTHATDDNSSTLTVWVAGNNDPAYGYTHVCEKSIATADYTVGTKLLVTISLKKDENHNIDPDDHTNTAAKVVTYTAAEAKNGKLTGASDKAYAESVSIDGTKYATNCRFVYGKNDAMNITNNGVSYTFYFDSYGNVIGREALQTDSQYAVLTKIYAKHPAGDFTIYGDLYDLSAKEFKTGVVIAAAGSFEDAEYGRGQNLNFRTDNKIDEIALNNDENLTNGLYTYTVNAKGAYELTWVGQYTEAAGYGRLNGVFTHGAKQAYIKGTSVYSIGGDQSQNAKYINISESTQFIVKAANDEWTTYTGYTELPALTAQYVDYVLEAGDSGFAAIVYLGNVSFEGDSVTGFVASWAPFDWANGYDLITVYVKGEPVVVNVDHDTLYTVAAAEGYYPGVYKFSVKVDKNGVSYSDIYKVAQKWTDTVASVKISNDNTAFTIVTTNTGAIGTSNSEIYRLTKDGKVVAATGADIVAGDKVLCYEYDKTVATSDQPYDVIFIIDKDFVPTHA